MFPVWLFLSNCRRSISLGHKLVSIYPEPCFNSSVDRCNLIRHSKGWEGWQCQLDKLWWTHHPCTLSHSVTQCHTVSNSVTQCHTVSNSVTQCQLDKLWWPPPLYTLTRVHISAGNSYTQVVSFSVSHLKPKRTDYFLRATKRFQLQCVL